MHIPLKLHGALGYVSETAYSNRTGHRSGRCMVSMLGHSGGGIKPQTCSLLPTYTSHVYTIGTVPHECFHVSVYTLMCITHTHMYLFVYISVYL